MRRACTNHVVCRNTTTKRRCVQCEMYNLKRVVVRPNPSECSVCLETGPHVMFPTRCGHSFCASCVRSILFSADDSSTLNDHTSAVPYGGPACPNGCANPAVGPQCKCTQRTDAEYAWSMRDFSAFTEWLSHSMTYRVSDAHPTAKGSMRCPLCRAKYKMPKTHDHILHRMQLIHVS